MIEVREVAGNVRFELWRDTVVVRKQFPHSDEGRHRHIEHNRWLQAAQDHPVVRLCTVDQTALVTSTAYAGSATFFSRQRRPGEAAKLLAKVAEALAGLHRHGLVHGNLHGDHIIVAGNAFRLCSPCDPADERARDPARDVLAFAPMIDSLCGNWAKPSTAGRAAVPISAGQRARWLEVGARAEDATLSADRLSRLFLALAAEPPRRFVWPRSAGAVSLR